MLRALADIVAMVKLGMSLVGMIVVTMLGISVSIMKEVFKR